MIPRTPGSTLTDPRFPYTTLFRADLFTVPSRPVPDDARTRRLPTGPAKLLQDRAGIILQVCEKAAPSRVDRVRVFDVAGVEFDDEACVRTGKEGRSEEHTSELQSLMRISYDVF